MDWSFFQQREKHKPVLYMLNNSLITIKSKLSSLSINFDAFISISTDLPWPLLAWLVCSSLTGEMMSNWMGVSGATSESRDRDDSAGDSEPTEHWLPDRAALARPCLQGKKMNDLRKKTWNYLQVQNLFLLYGKSCVELKCIYYKTCQMIGIINKDFFFMFINVRHQGCIYFITKKPPNIVKKTLKFKRTVF